MKLIIILLSGIIILSTIFIVGFTNTNEEPYGLYRTYTNITKDIQSLKSALYEEACEKCAVLFERSETRRISGKADIFDGVKATKLVTKEIDAKNIAIETIQNNKNLFGVSIEELPSITVRKSTDANGGYNVDFEWQQYKGIKVCSREKNAGGFKVNPNGGIDYFLIDFYPNLTTPTRPKLTDEQIKQKLGITFPLPPSKLCIFPKWHPDGEYWTYHLAKDYDGLIIDSWTGEPLFEPKAIVE